MAREFNADQRAKEREESHVTIGEKVFLPIRQSNKVVKKVRSAAIAGQGALIALQKRAEAAEKDAKAAGRDAAGDAALSEEIEDASVNGFLDQIVLLIVDEDGKPPTKAHLIQSLDRRDIQPLLEWLLGGEEGEGNSSAAGPTPTASTTA